MSIVSENIKFLRKSNGLTQEQFAGQIGIKRSLLGAYEEGRANPNLGNLMNIAKIFGMAVDELLQNDLRKAEDVPAAKPAARTIEPTHSVQGRTLGTTKPQTISVKEHNATNGRHQPEVRPITTGTAHYGIHSRSDNQESSIDIQRLAAMPDKDSLAHTSFVVPLVRAGQATSYVLHYAQPHFLQQLPALHLPTLPPGDYRAFEIGEDFAFPGAIVVGQQVNNLYDVADGKNYLFVLHRKGIVYRRVYSQMRIKGTLLLTSDKATIPSLEIAAKEALEVWEAKAFFSMQLPEPTVSLERISQLVADMQQELDRLKK